MAAARHRPALAAGEGALRPRRSLLRAGGGMRVAYQAGVMVALEQARLRIADGTSGGTMNLAMLLSGLSPAEICQRWRTLEPRAYVSLLPLRRLVRGPPYPALGDAPTYAPSPTPFRTTLRHLRVSLPRERPRRLLSPQER